MTSVAVSTVTDVLEQLRQEVVAHLQSRKIEVPGEALVSGRVGARSRRMGPYSKQVPAAPKNSSESPELKARIRAA